MDGAEISDFIEFEDLLSSGKYDVVIAGHTHNQEARKVGSTLFINPCILETGTMKVDFIKVDKYK